MKINWLATTAVALVIGSGAVIAQTQSDQKREEGSRAQQTKDTDREKGTAQQKNRTGQPEQKGSKEQRGGANTPAERKQSQEPQHDTPQPTKQSQDQQKRGEPSSAPTQQSQDQQKGRDTKQSEQKNQARDTKQPEQKNQARDAKQPTDTKQQQGQQTPSTTPSNNQAAQPSSSTTPTQQSAQPNNATDRNRQGQASGQNDRNRSGTSTSVTANDPQRTQVIDRLRNDRAARNPNINIQVSIGQRLPPRVHARRLPPDIVHIEPRYRGYEYTVVEDQIYIVEPRTKKVVDILREPGSSVQTHTTYRSDRVVLSTEQRETLKQSAHRLSSAPVAGTPSGSSPDSSCLTLLPVPEEIARSNPELGQYKMLAIGDQLVLVDPRQQKVVEVIE